MIKSRARNHLYRTRLAVELQVVKASDNYKAVGIMAVEGEPGLTGYTENQGFPYACK